MSAASRFLVVIALGTVMVAGAIALLWVAGVRGRLGVAVPLALTLAAMQLLDDRLAGRPAVVWRAVGMGATAGLAGWLMLGMLES